MDPITIQKLESLARGQTNEKLASFSGITNAMIIRGLSMEPDKPYGPSLEPVIAGSIHKGFLRHDNRMASLQATDTYNSTKTLHLATNTLSLVLQLFELLGHKLDGNPFQRIAEESERKGIEALTKRDPKMLEMVRNTHLNPNISPPDEEGKAD